MSRVPFILVVVALLLAYLGMGVNPMITFGSAKILFYLFLGLATLALLYGRFSRTSS